MVSTTSARWIRNQRTYRIECKTGVIAHSDAVNNRPVGRRDFDDADNIRHCCIGVQVSLSRCGQIGEGNHDKMVSVHSRHDDYTCRVKVDMCVIFEAYDVLNCPVGQGNFDNSKDFWRIQGQ